MFLNLLTKRKEQSKGNYYKVNPYLYKDLKKYFNCSLFNSDKTSAIRRVDFFEP